MGRVPAGPATTLGMTDWLRALPGLAVHGVPVSMFLLPKAVISEPTSGPPHGGAEFEMAPRYGIQELPILPGTATVKPTGSETHGLSRFQSQVQDGASGTRSVWKPKSFPLYHDPGNVALLCTPPQASGETESEKPLPAA